MHIFIVQIYIIDLYFVREVGKNMKKKIVGIFVMTLLIATAVLPVAGTIYKKSIKTFSNEKTEISVI